MTAIVYGAWAGFQEFLLAPFGLWSMHKEIVARQTVEHVSSAPLHNQALRRLQLQAATPSRHGEFTSRRHRSPLLTPTATPKMGCTDLGLYSSLEDLKSAPEGATGDRRNPALKSSRSDGIFRLLSYIWFYNMLLVFVMGLTFNALSIIASCSFGLWLSSLWIVSIPCHLVIIVLQNFIFLVMELVNVIYLKVSFRASEPPPRMGAESELEGRALRRQPTTLSGRSPPRERALPPLLLPACQGMRMAIRWPVSRLFTALENR
uniref:Anoctamin n=1 Tax=Schistocephalus solidus TaxID=70667 RepID=A0A0X3PWZ7_SCHSO